MIALKFIFIFITIFLWHELMHIKSQGLKATGTIFVHKFGFTCITDNTWNNELRRLAGGLFSSLVSFIMFFATTDIEFRFSFFVVGWINLCYGIAEWKGQVTKSYTIYFISGFLSILYWLACR